MPRQAFLRPEAAREIAEAFAWYEARRNGLGRDYLQVVDSAISSAMDNPEQFPKVHGDIRRVLVRRFPFGVFYLAESDHIIILAVFHARRDPRQWQERAAT